MQLFVGHDAPTPELLKPVKNDPRGYFRQKPEGGLWTSAWREETQDSDWVEWCRSEAFGSVDAEHWWLLTPEPDVRLYTIDSLADFNQCLREYGFPDPVARLDALFAGKRAIDFEKLAQKYDGLHLTERGNAATHLSHPNDLNAWDCESTLWFRWCFERVEQFTRREEGVFQ